MGRGELFWLHQKQQNQAVGVMLDWLLRLHTSAPIRTWLHAHDIRESALIGKE